MHDLEFGNNIASSGRLGCLSSGNLSLSMDLWVITRGTAKLNFLEYYIRHMGVSRTKLRLDVQKPAHVNGEITM